MDRNEAFYKLMDMINTVSDKIVSYNKKPRQYGTEDTLFVVEAHTIDKIGRDPDITVTQIAENMYKTKGAVSQTIDRLIQKDLLERTVNPEDTRKNILTLTEKGQTVYTHHKEKDKLAYDRYLNRLEAYDEDDFEMCMDILSKIFKIEK
ncbi:hypothetical protein AN639_05665 [Candidatus Epulonipiscium fishelsonii]|nr:hypothetical protein AN639_05665 [Epulopiscium sp. SCG-B05WGA-EpuloA1]ONI47808.1 hypothetical protein AN644_03800 [Epulopiscium sp. SCG-C06WGA-EpuloA1]